MKYVVLILINLLLVNNSIWSQTNNKPYTQNEWEKTVDYVNSKILLLYMEEIKAQKDLNDQEKSSYDEFKKSNLKNIIENPIEFKILSPMLSKAWSNTYQNIASPIDSFKSLNEKDPIVLFIKVESLLKARSSKVYISNDFIQLKKEILGKNSNPIVSKEVQNEIEARSTNQVLSNRSIETPDQKPSITLYHYLMIPIVLFMLSTLFFGLKFKQAKNDLKKQEEKYLLLENAYNQNQIKLHQKQNEIGKLNNDIRYQSNTPQEIKNPNNKSELFVEERPTEVKFQIEETPKKATILYAGKPSVDHFLTNISTEPLNNTTIFKLFISPNNQHLAEFEVILVDNFMTRNITNHPDDYLYRVCNHENSNREFTKSIITIKKGRAEFQEGNWRVREENKATIKFQ